MSEKNNLDGFQQYMFFNTTFRNVGLFTSIAFLSLAYAKGQTGFMRLIARLLVVMFILVSMILNYNAYKTLKDNLARKPPVKGMETLKHYEYIAILMTPVHLAILFLNFYKIFSENI